MHHEFLADEHTNKNFIRKKKAEAEVEHAEKKPVFFVTRREGGKLEYN